MKRREFMFGAAAGGSPAGKTSPVQMVVSGADNRGSGWFRLRSYHRTIGTIAPEFTGTSSHLGGVVYDASAGENSKVPNIGGIRKSSLP
jgi:hypothetical protein